MTNVRSARARATYENHPTFFREAFSKLLRHTCVALRREPHFENHPPSIREAFANVQDECARRQGESHTATTARPLSATLLQSFKV
eukprot:4045534-Pyramimonas_sp.AAC.1